MAGRTVGTVPALELVTVGQRHGLGVPGGGTPQYALAVDVPAATVTVGSAQDLLTDRVTVDELAWAAGSVEGPLLAQVSAHGAVRRCRVEGTTVVFDEPARRVAPGQSLVLYDGPDVVGAARVA
jgi:tRNA-specific 2-thiouridylase